MNQSPEDAVGPHSELLLGLASQLRRRNVEQSVAFKDVFNAHQGLLHVNEKLRQQTLEQDKVTHESRCADGPLSLHSHKVQRGLHLHERRSSTARVALLLWESASSSRDRKGVVFAFFAVNISGTSGCC